MAQETATLAAYVADLKFADIPPEVLERAKVLTLDFLGSAIRARRDAESTPSLLNMLEALALDGKNPFVLDCKAPSLPLDKYIYNETRYTMLVHSKPDDARRLLAEAQADVMNRWRIYEQMAAMPGAESKTTEGGK